MRRPLATFLVGMGLAASLGPAHAQVAEQREEIFRLVQFARFPEAIAAAEAMVDRTRSSRGEQSLEHAMALEALAHAVGNEGSRISDPALHAAVERALSIKREVLTPDHPEVARSLRQRGRLRLALGDLDAARQDLEAALAIFTAADAPPPERGWTLINLGLLEYYSSHYAQAESRIDAALTVFGPAPSYPRALAQGNLANIFSDTGRFQASLDLYDQVLDGLRQLGMEDVPYFGVHQVNKATMLEYLGEVEAAVDAYESGVRRLEATLGPDHPDTHWAQSHLADFLSELGAYDRARPVLERSYARTVDLMGPDHFQTAVMRRALGLILWRLGDLGTAAHHTQASVQIMESSAGPAHPLTLETMMQLAGILLDQGDLSASDQILTAVERRVESRPDPENADLLGLRMSWAEARQRRGDLDGAVIAYRSASATAEAAFGEVHPVVATALLEVGRIQSGRGEPGALETMSRALRLHRTIYTDDHPAVGLVHRALAEHHRRHGGGVEMRDHAVSAERIGRESLRLSVQALPEREALIYARQRVTGLDLLVEEALRSRDGTAVASACDAIIRARALTLDEFAARHRESIARDDPVLQGLRAQVRDATRRLSNLVTRGRRDEALPEYRAVVAAARTEKERAELALAEVSVTYRRRVEGSRAGLKEIQERLEPAAAVLSYWTTSSSEAERQYVAFLITRHRVAVFHLGSGAVIDAAVRGWREEIVRGTAATSADHQRYLTVAGDLRRLVWDPVAPGLKGREDVVVVPSGALHTVSFESLPGDDGSFLVQADLRMHRLSCERDLVEPRPASVGHGLLVLGGPDFDDDSMFALDASRGGFSATDAFQTMRFVALPHAEQEARDVADLWRRRVGGPRWKFWNRGRTPVERLSGASATESALKRAVAGVRVLHLATHGFFVGGEDRESPLLQSGLALAGANYRLNASVAGDDGVLTAEEVATLDLTGVEVAVLSACDTGQGAVQLGEGVLGFQRAFRTAGAQSVVMSLWSVSDQAARAWMRSLYSHLLPAGGLPARLDVQGATRVATLEALARVEASGRPPHPSEWAGFVAVGTR